MSFNAAKGCQKEGVLFLLIRYWIIDDRLDERAYKGQRDIQMIVIVVIENFIHAV